MEKICIVIPCFNEVDNIGPLFDRIYNTIEPTRSKYQYEILVVDNCSDDGTQEVVENMAKKYPSVTIIFLRRNYGPIKSPYWGFVQSPDDADALIFLASDLEDPPELIPEFINGWKNGSDIVFGQYKQSPKKFLKRIFSKVYYWGLNKIVPNNVLANVTGFGLYSREVVLQVKNNTDHNTYLRGFVTDLGFSVSIVEFEKEPRPAGMGKNGYLGLIDNAILGFVDSSTAPIRIVTMLSVATLLFYSLVVCSVIIAAIVFGSYTYLLPSLLLFPLIFVNTTACMVLGEYIAMVSHRVNPRPPVTERTRVGHRAR